MAQFQCSQYFDNQEKVEALLKEFFVLKDKNWDQCGI